MSLQHVPCACSSRAPQTRERFPELGTVLSLPPRRTPLGLPRPSVVAAAHTASPLGGASLGESSCSGPLWGELLARSDLTGRPQPFRLHTPPPGPVLVLLLFARLRTLLQRSSESLMVLHEDCDRSPKPAEHWYWTSSHEPLMFLTTSRMTNPFHEVS